MNAQAAAFALSPPPSVRFEPIPFVLVRVHAPWCVPEQVHGDMGPEWHGITFDPWRKGDLIVVCKRSRATYQPGVKGPQYYETWRVARRATKPSAARPKVDYQLSEKGALIADGSPYGGDNFQIWRIPFRHRQAALTLNGQEFETREQIEAAILAYQP